FAVVGMSGRFPGCRDVAEFWQRVARGEELIRELRSSPSRRSGGGRWVRAAAPLDRYDCFDAEFFGLTPSEAALRDPQHRVFLEAAWAALEDAGYDCRRNTRPVGVFAGATLNTYLTHNL